MNGQEIEHVKEKRDLGVLFTEYLKVAGQCMQAFKKANRALGIISHVISYRSKGPINPVTNLLSGHT